MWMAGRCPRREEGEVQQRREGLGRRSTSVLESMEMLRRSHFVAVLGVFLIGLAFPVMGQSSASPAMAPSSDGTSIDQGIAYMLMIAALVLTYLIHPLDASSFYRSFFS
ncbi:unnamed protein product [Victoria cruziana]